MTDFSEADLVKNTAGFDQQEFYKDLGIRLRFHRKAALCTQQEMADAIGIPRATYANAESGRSRVTLDVVWRIAVVLGKRLDRIVPQPVGGTATP